MTPKGIKVTVQIEIKTPLSIVWKLWSTPSDICGWNFASDDWHNPKAENDLNVGGKFCYRMEAKDGSFGFDFSGVYTTVDHHKTIRYTLDDARTVEINFTETKNGIRLEKTFEAETENPVELQKQGWQMILNNFKRYAEKC